MASLSTFSYQLKEMKNVLFILFATLVISTIFLIIFSIPYYGDPDHASMTLMAYTSYIVIVIAIVVLILLILSGKWVEYLHGKAQPRGIKYLFWLFIIFSLIFALTGALLEMNGLREFVSIFASPLNDWGLGLLDFIGGLKLFEYVAAIRFFFIFVFIFLGNIWLYYQIGGVERYDKNVVLEELKQILTIPEPEPEPETESEA